MAAEIETIARAWMAHQGYTDDEVNGVCGNAVSSTTHWAHGCEFEGDTWNCIDDDGKSRHPVWDALQEACDMANVAVKALESIGWLGPDLGSEY
jgi:hypothetical protein